MELVTTHAHTSFCGHGEGTVEELAAAAEAAGVTTLAVTEHYPLSKAFDPRDYLSMPAARVGEYLAAIDEARERIKQATRRYAKRQRTWFRKDARIAWLDADGADARELADEACTLLETRFLSSDPQHPGM